MRDETRTRQRLVGIFLAGLVLFNYPVLATVGDRIGIAGAPALFVFLFSVWALLIVAMAFAAERRD
jgi:hypothetical protein